MESEKDLWLISRVDTLQQGTDGEAGLGITGGHVIGIL